MWPDRRFILLLFVDIGLDRLQDELAKRGMRRPTPGMYNSMSEAEAQLHVHGLLGDKGFVKLPAEQWDSGSAVWAAAQQRFSHLPGEDS